MNRQCHLVNLSSRGVRKVDVVLVALGVVVAVATAVGVAKSDDWTGERTYTFTATEVALPAQGPVPAGSAPARFEWPAPANATGATLEVRVSATGQAVRGGVAIIRVGGVAPDGTNLPPETHTMAIGQGSTANDIGFSYNVTWAEAPDRVRDTQVPGARAWDGPLVVTVTVERPSDLPAATYSFTAAANGTFAAYASR